jgi:hypothetical protein
MTIVGQTIGFPRDTNACPRAEVLAANPSLVAILADPYGKPAEFVLDNPAYRVDSRYIKSGGVSDPP